MATASPRDFKNYFNFVFIYTPWFLLCPLSVFMNGFQQCMVGPKFHFYYMCPSFTLPFLGIVERMGSSLFSFSCLPHFPSFCSFLSLKKVKAKFSNIIGELQLKPCLEKLIGAKINCAHRFLKNHNKHLRHPYFASSIILELFLNSFHLHNAF